MTAPATIDSQNLSELLGSATPPRVLDVRTPGEFETAHIAGAYNVPLDLLREHRDEIIKHLDEDVVLVCRSGQRAAQAEETLRNAGLANVHILDGGITAWEAKGFAVNRGAQRWDLERQVRLVAGSIVLTSILGSIAVPEAQVGRRRDRRRTDLRRADQHLRDGHAAGQAALQPRRHLRRPDHRGPAASAPARPEGELTDHDRADHRPGRVRRHRLGLLGGGGSILTVPLLAYVAGMDAKQAIATSLLVVGVTSAVGAISHARAGRVQWRTGLIFGARRHGRRLRRRPAGPVHPGHGPAHRLRRDDDRHRHRHAARTQERRRHRRRGTACPSPKIIAEGLVVGLVTGLVGAGGGFLVVPALALLGGLPMPVAVGTSLIVIAMKSFAGLGGYLSSVQIDWTVALAVTAAAVVGSLARRAADRDGQPRRAAQGVRLVRPGDVVGHPGPGDPPGRRNRRRGTDRGCRGAVTFACTRYAHCPLRRLAASTGLRVGGRMTTAREYPRGYHGYSVT